MTDHADRANETEKEKKTKACCKRTETAEKLVRDVGKLDDCEMLAAMRTLGMLESAEGRALRPKPYQLQTLRFALETIGKKRCSPAHPAGCLVGLDVGLGKTFVALCVVAVLQALGRGPCLVLCPAGIRVQWTVEAHKWFGRTFRMVMADTAADMYTQRDRGSPLCSKRAPATLDMLREADVVVMGIDAYRACWAEHVGRVADAGAAAKAPSASATPAEKLSRALRWVDVRDGPNATPVAECTEAAAALLPALLSMQWSALVVDESHEIRNAATKRFKACRFVGVSDYVLLLSGTAVVNAPEDLWAQLCCLRCPALPRPSDFARACAGEDAATRAYIARHVFTMRKESMGAVAPSAKEEAKKGEEEADGWTLYRKATKEMPAAYARTVTVDPTAELDKALYTAAADTDRMLHDQGGGVLRAYGIMRQLSEDWRYPTTEVRAFLTGLRDLRWASGDVHPKIDTVVRHVAQIPAGDKAIVYCSYTGTVRDVSERLAALGIACAAVDGATPRDERAAILARFAGPRDPCVLVCTHVAEEGYNLQCANHVFFASTWWNSQGDDQCIGRMHRIGQTKTVYATWFVMRANPLYLAVEQVMVDRCRQKRLLVDAVGAISEHRPILSSMGDADEKDMAAVFAPCKKRRRTKYNCGDSCEDDYEPRMRPAEDPDFVPSDDDVRPKVAAAISPTATVVVAPTQIAAPTTGCDAVMDDVLPLSAPIETPLCALDIEEPIPDKSPTDSARPLSKSHHTKRRVPRIVRRILAPTVGMSIASSNERAVAGTEGDL